MSVLLKQVVITSLIICFSIKSLKGSLFADNQTLWTEFAKDIQSIQKVIKNSTDGYSYSYFNYIETESVWPELCSNGSNQSPINIVPDYNETFANLMNVEIIDLVPGNCTLVGSYSNGGFIDLTKALGSLMFVKFGIKYKYLLEKLAVKYPAEHLFGGVRFDMEIQLEYKKDPNFIPEGITDNVDPDKPFTRLIISNLFDKSQASDDTNIRELRVSTNGPITNFFRLEKLVPKNQPYFFYEGSLTYPNCTEDVNWIINRHIFSTSGGQLSNFMGWINFAFPLKGNSRSVKTREAQVYFQMNQHLLQVTRSTYFLIKNVFLVVLALTTLIL